MRLTAVRAALVGIFVTALVALVPTVGGGDGFGWPRVASTITADGFGWGVAPTGGATVRSV